VDGSTPIEAPPPDAAGFRMALDRLGAPRRLLLAVSGGADSMAMMRLAAPLGARFKISVATVDHQLRSGARAEAELVAGEARRLGFSHAILDWDGVKPASGVQAAARRARYRLLIDHACALGADAIVTAHNADDQAETVFMRLQRGSGPRGLAGMIERSFVAADAGEALPLLRPLLGVRRRALRKLLTAENAAFVDDPSNEDAAFERVRVRRTLVRLEEEGALSVAALCETARAAREAADRIEAQENERFAALGGALDDNGIARLKAAKLSVGDAPLIARLIQAVACGDHQPDADRSAAALMAALSGRKATLGGAMLARSDADFFIFREPAAVLGRAGVAPLGMVRLQPGGRALWDARFIVSNPTSEAVDVRPAGAAGAGDFPGEDPDRIAGAPALWGRGGLLGLAAEFDAAKALADERFFRRVNRFAEIT